MNNPLHILRALDRHLTSPCHLYVYGRSALALGFPTAPAKYSATMDVDALLPAKDIQAIEQNADFWLAQEKTMRNSRTADCILRICLKIVR